MRKHRFTLGLVLAIAIIAVYFVFNFKTLFGVNQEEKNVTVILETLNSQLDFFQAINQGAEAAAKETGITLTVEGPLIEGDSNAQIEILEAAIRRKPQAIVMDTVSDDRIPAILDKARASGIKLVILNHLPHMVPPPVVVSSNHVEAGKQAGQTAIKETEGRPVIVVIGDDGKSIISEERLAGVRFALQGYKNSLKGPFFTENSEERAYEIAKSLLEGDPRINTIITLKQSASLGVAKLLKEQNKANDIDLIGFDNTGNEVQLLESGIIKASIVQKPFNMGYLGVKTALKLINGKETNPITYIESNVIIKENMYTTENQKLLFPFITSK